VRDKRREAPLNKVLMSNDVSEIHCTFSVDLWVSGKKLSASAYSLTGFTSG
jgi:hypothetical protein